MTETMTMMTIACLGLVAFGIALIAALKGWQGWLDLKRLELTGRDGDRPSSAIERIEMADLKERIRKLESIAACVDL